MSYDLLSAAKKIFAPVWRLWANKGDDNLYLAARSSAGTSKISFHESGIARFAAISKRPRAPIESWRRPAETEPNVTPIFSVVVPALVIRNRFVDELPPPHKPTIYIPPPTMAQKIVIRMILTKSGFDLRTIRTGEKAISFHGTVRLKTETAWLVSYIDNFNVDELQYVMRMIATTKISLKSGSKKDDVERAHLHILEKGRIPSIVDLQLGSDNIYIDKS